MNFDQVDPPFAKGLSEDTRGSAGLTPARLAAGVCPGEYPNRKPVSQNAQICAMPRELRLAIDKVGGLHSGLFQPTSMDDPAIVHQMATLYHHVLTRDEKIPISQYLLQGYSIGAMEISQVMVTEPVQDYGLTLEASEAITVEGLPQRAQGEPRRRLIQTKSDLASFVHRDKTEQYQGAVFINGQNGVKLHPQSPVHHREDHADFVHFSDVHICGLLGYVTHRLLAAAFWAKGQYNAGRPEEIARAFELQRLGRSVTIGADAYEVFKADPVVQAYFEKYGTYLLNLRFPEGSPIHSRFPAGHNWVATGLCFTLSYWYDRNSELPVFEASSDRRARDTGRKTTVGAELDLLRDNIGHGRDMAGVHLPEDSSGVGIGEIANLIAAEAIREYNALVCPAVMRPRAVETYGGGRIWV